MYLSQLLIDVGDNPDRPRPGRRWLTNIYHVHQRLAMAFPSDLRRAEDPQFLRPYDPADFPEGASCQGESRPTPFLFRIDSGIHENRSRAVILVQSQEKPDWNYAFHNARMFLAAQPEYREDNLHIQQGSQLRFRVKMNLTKKTTRAKDGTDLRQFPQNRTDKTGRPRSQGKRVSLTWEKGRNPEEVIREWFAAKARRSGFQIDQCSLINLGWVYGSKPLTGARHDESDPDKRRRRLKFRSAILEGALTVNDAEQFARARAGGIGAAKAFGFGLLSVAPVQD